MSNRDHERLPGRLQVEFRSANSLLVAYTVNLSRGGMFVESAAPFPSVGSEIRLDLLLPTSESVEIAGRVAWTRTESTHQSPSGFGVQFTERSAELDQAIDEIVQRFSGIRILLLCSDKDESEAIARKIRSFLPKSKLLELAASDDLSAAMTEDLDLIVLSSSNPQLCEQFSKKCEKLGFPLIVLWDESESQNLLAQQGYLAGSPSTEALRKAILSILSTPSRVSTEAD